MSNCSDDLIYKIKEYCLKNANKIERCDCTVLHGDVVTKVQSVMPMEEDLSDLAESFKVFGDTTRIKILSGLFEAEMCVCDIAFLLNMTQSAISHQLRVLKQAGLVKNRKDGKVVFYSIDDEHIKHIFDQGLARIMVNKKGKI